MSSIRSSYAQAELTASEAMIAVSMSPSKKKMSPDEAKAVGPASTSSHQNDILPSKRSANPAPPSSSRSLFSPPNKGAGASIVTPKSTIKTPRVTRGINVTRPTAARKVTAGVANSATKQQEKTEDDDGVVNFTNVNNSGAGTTPLETPIFHRGTTAANSSAATKPSNSEAARNNAPSPSTVVLPLLTLRSAYNANAHESLDKQSEIVAHVTAKMAAKENRKHHIATNNNNGVASYVEQAAEEDIKTKLIMEINDLKQLLCGRKAQVDSLSAEKNNLEEKLHRSEAKKQRRSGSVSSRSPTPTRFLSEDHHQVAAKVTKGMQLDALQIEAVARGMDATNMTKETLLDTLVIGTTCISKSSAWSEVMSLRCEIENEKVAIRLQEEEDKQRLQEMETKRELKREQRLQKKKEHQEDRSIVPSNMIVTESGTAFTRGGLEALARAAKVTIESELQRDNMTPPPVKRPRGRPRKDGKISFKKSPPPPSSSRASSRTKKRSVFENIAAMSPEPPTGGSYPSLYDIEDETNTHPSHAIIRRDILEAFVTVAPKDDEEETSTESKKKLTRRRRYAGKVGFRCRYCKDEHVDDQADLAVIYPESINGIYRANIRFQSKHIQACPFIPQSLRDQLSYLKSCKEGSNRGNRTYWTESALRKGFRDWESPDGERKGIIYCPELNNELKKN